MDVTEPALAHQLERAETELACAEQIGDFDRMKRETARWRERIAQIKAKMENPDAV